jgi:hypothetical protein
LTNFRLFSTTFLSFSRSIKSVMTIFYLFSNDFNLFSINFANLDNFGPFLTTCNYFLPTFIQVWAFSTTFQLLSIHFQLIWQFLTLSYFWQTFILFQLLPSTFKPAQFWTSFDYFSTIFDQFPIILWKISTFFWSKSVAGYGGQKRPL